MNRVISQLEKITKKQLFAEKVLIVPTYSVGRQFLESATKQGLNILNLRITTLFSLAEQVCQQELLKSRRSLIEPTLVYELFADILKKLTAEGSLTYFGSLEITPGVSRAIYQAILDLEMAGLSALDLSCTAKQRDLKLIWVEYKKELERQKFLDQAGLFQLAISQRHQLAGIYIVPSSLQMASLECEFFRKITKDNFEVIDMGKPKGINPPQNSIDSEAASIETMTEGLFNKLLWLYDLANAPVTETGSVDMFRAYGERNELREVLTRIKERGIPFDQAVVYYSAQEPYTHLFYTLTQELQIPVTFGQGIDIRLTSAGRLFFGFLAWAEGGFKVSDLVPLFLNGDLKISDEKAPSKSTIVRFFRTSGIGWGYERYVSVIEETLSQLESESDSEDETYRQQNLGNLRWLKDFIGHLFSSWPVADAEGRLSFGGFAGWVHDLIDKFASISSEAAGEAKKIIRNELKLIKDSFPEYLDPEEAYARLKAVIEGKRVYVSNPRPAHLHIDHYSAASWIMRSHVFVVGLDANRFPGAIIQDPILLDEERRNLGHGLPLGGLKAKEKTYELIQSLSLVPETLTLSYSAFDTVENRMIFPAAVLLQLHRLLRNNEQLDYSDLLDALGERRGFVPRELEKAVGETEWWLSVLADGNRYLEPETLQLIYPSLYDGLQAKNQRMKPDMTPYDGQVTVDCSEVDPTVNHEMVMSCSQLEMLGKCPYAYFLRYLLRIKPIDEFIFDPGVWLDPMTKGELYHSIFEQFYKDLTVTGERPELSKHENHLFEIADELIANKKNLIPPPSDLVFDQERQGILDSCRVFLKAEEEETHKGSPKYLELTFGMPSDKEEYGSVDAVPIHLDTDKKFFLRGRIDRVDETSDGLKVWDYKSGSTYGYSESKYYQGGRQLQHGLYPLALENLLSEKGLHPDPHVIESGYIFPTVKGEGKRMVRQQIRRESLYEILGHLFDLLAQGTFVMTDNSDDCKYCDFANACNRAFRTQEGLEKMMIDTFRRLRNYA